MPIERIFPAFTARHIALYTPSSLEPNRAAHAHKDCDEDERAVKRRDDRHSRRAERSLGLPDGNRIDETVDRHDKRAAHGRKKEFSVQCSC